MVWTEGHVWRTVKPIITSEPMFSYKYALLDGENGEEQELLKWEKGVDRLCQCSLLEEQAGSSSTLKHIRLDDVWEKFKVKFTVFYPIDQPGDKLQVTTENTVEGP